ncbi:MAG: 4-alpha-glucanotransferase [Lachnospiraceae bacterium]
MRKNGILLPITSLPSKYGIGGFSKEAYEFVDFLALAGQEYWQVLPMGPTGYGDSPYQSFSTFAGNPYFVDLEDMIARGWLTAKECEKYPCGDNPEYVDYEKIYLSRFKLLKKAFKKSRIAEEKAFVQFVKDNAFWLEDYALFMAIKNRYKGGSYTKWPEELRLRKNAAMKAIRKDEKIAEEVMFYQFIQFMFYSQWAKLKAYANEKGIEIIGDIPIYVAFDSADTWANPELFQLDETNTPLAVAGCPPDYFSATGQLWGNPLYRWDYHKKTEYAWWMKRLEYCFKLYDVVRIDHFRGFDEYYSIPYGDKTAEFGHWEKGPGYELFETMRKKLGKQRIIAEDLGLLTPSVLKLVKKCGYPGMKILEFAFDSGEENDYLPHNYEKNCIVYTGTHDNDTVFGWYPTLKKEDKTYVRDYLNVKSRKDIGWGLIRLALSSTADTAIIPMQDYLELGSEARINIPSTLGGNWTWRMKENAYTKELAAKIAKLAKIYGR